MEASFAVLHKHTIPFDTNNVYSINYSSDFCQKDFKENVGSSLIAIVYIEHAWVAFDMTGGEWCSIRVTKRKKKLHWHVT